MNHEQKKYSIISLILIVLAIILPIVAISVTAAGIDDPDFTKDPENDVLPGAAIIGTLLFGFTMVIYMLIIVVFGCSISGILGYAAYALASKAIRITPAGEKIPAFPKVLRVIALIETVFSAVAIISGCACMVFG